MFKKLYHLKNLYKRGINILDYLRKEDGTNIVDDIKISYDLQSGSYTKEFEKNPLHYQKYTIELVNVINQLGSFQNILEAGVGEATTMVNMLLNLNNFKRIDAYGFDISWSRLRYGKRFSEKNNCEINLFMGDLFSIPIADEAIDVVYTSHSIEPNGGREEEALKELYRITKKYLILLEPDYEIASNNAKERMISNGYVTNLNKAIKNLGYKVVVDEKFRGSSNKLNPTGLKIIKKIHDKESRFFFMCPHTGFPLDRKREVYNNKDAGIIYPIIDGIPCLLSTNAILATHFDEF